MVVVVVIGERHKVAVVATAALSARPINYEFYGSKTKAREKRRRERGWWEEEVEPEESVLWFTTA